MQYTELLVTKRDDYQEYASAEHRKFVEARVRFLRRCPRMLKAMAMSEANDQEIRVLAQSLKEQTFRSHDVICKQGAQADFMVLVRSGTLLQVRAVDPRAHMKQEVGRTSSEVSPTRSVRQTISLADEGSFEPMVSHSETSRTSRRVERGSSEKKSRFSKLLQVGTLPACTCFGCHEVVTGMKWPFSLVAETVAEVYTISKQDLLRAVAKKLLASLVEVSREMQYSDAWLLHLNRQTERWDAYKEDMIKKAVEDVRDASEVTEAWQGPRR